MKNEDDMFQNPKVEQVLRETARIFREQILVDNKGIGRGGKVRWSHFNPMLGLVSGITDIPSPIEEGIQKAYTCPRGHTFQTKSPIVVAVDEDPEYNTGPICGYCYVDWFKANLNANEVLEDY